MAFEVTNAEITLGELQKDVLMLFEKDISFFSSSTYRLREIDHWVSACLEQHRPIPYVTAR